MPSEVTGGIDVERADGTRTRREEYAEATHDALLDSASDCFMEKGFASTSLDEVARGARVTKGAIYHHFSSKKELFHALLDRQEEVSVATVLAAADEMDDAWDAIVHAFDSFLELVSEPHYQRLCWVEGPSALGFEEWWDCGERYQIGVIRTLLERAAAAGLLAVSDVDMLARVLFGAVVAGVLAMARSEQPRVERGRFRSVMLDVMAGLVRSAPE